MLFLVHVEIAVCVEAQSEEEAEKIGAVGAVKDMSNTGPDLVSARLIVNENQIPLEWRHSVPWGATRETALDRFRAQQEKSHERSQVGTVVQTYR